MQNLLKSLSAEAHKSRFRREGWFAPDLGMLGQHASFSAAEGGWANKRAAGDAVRRPT